MLLLLFTWRMIPLEGTADLPLVYRQQNHLI